MTARTVNGSIKIREKHKIFKETGSPFDTTPIHSIKVRLMNCLTSRTQTYAQHNRFPLRGTFVVQDAHEVHLCSEVFCYVGESFRVHFVFYSRSRTALHSK